MKTCIDCQGLGKKKRRIKKSIRLRYQVALAEFEKSNGEIPPPIRPEAQSYTCESCSGSGLIASENFPVPNTENYPHVAIIGGGIGGVALAVACLHRGIPFTLYERDRSFDERSQGYGLTLQQASKAIDGFGIFNLQKGVISTRHLVHTPEGKVVGEWGMRKWLDTDVKSTPKRTNVHVARQALRQALLDQLGTTQVQWAHQLVDFKETSDGKIDLTFQVNGKTKNTRADLLVGADGIRSAVRNLLIGEEASPLRYLGCIVILGICPLSELAEVESSLLDSATVFQTANGNERIYIMPYDSDSVMWQLSFPMTEAEAKTLSAKGPHALKEAAIRRTPWHQPIPRILATTNETQISGYPVYDRALLTSALLENAGSISLIGDAAHPMSPFKGQGANQALLDALSLARTISKGCKPLSHWREKGLRETVLNKFETEMLARSATKVEDSAAAAEFLHSEIALYEGNEPRGRVLKRKES
ncbi:FAD-dependent monooxygenase [Chryseobacterium sp. SNU WT5]|uniref:FAD-dependent oxidoreductase n=1 Tax=Chryseobacterium sp. SNU WT5 TaxID=2594269 RepID=UPI001180DAC7|nr:NAD(P)/FAD-dependent oxidoreductase [Chryseobacterium sp. SNU WT5]QDP84498.1 FAD-dependent monooxygenase [Chryseobacterium sp. SNU WT5]